MRVAALLLLCSLLGGCAATRVNSRSLRPTVASPSGEWQEVLLEPKASSHMEQFRAPEVDVVGVRRMGVRGRDSLVHRLPRRSVSTDTVDFRYEFRGIESFRATVKAQLVVRQDASNPLLGRRVTADGRDGRSFHAVKVEATHRMQLGSDSSVVWELVSGSDYRERTLDEELRYELTLTLRRGERSFTVVPMSSHGPVSADVRRSNRRMWRATGWAVEENGQLFGVVQINGATPFGQNDKRAWVPSGLTVAERQERLAVLMMLLMVDSQLPYQRAM